MRQKETNFTRIKTAVTTKYCPVIMFGTLVFVFTPFFLVSAADWIKLGATRERSESYYDRESIIRDGDIVTVQVKKSLVDESARNFILRVNCPDATFSISEPIGRDNLGEQDRVYKFTPWEIPSPGTLADGFRDHVCRKKAKRK